MHRSLTCFSIFLLAMSATFAQKLTLPPTEFYAHLKSKQDIQLLDIRSQDDFANGHIRKARNLDYALDEFEQRVTSNFSKALPLYIYCNTATRSAEALTFLTEIGFTKVVQLENGFVNWLAESLPYRTDRTNTTPVATFTMTDLTRYIKQEETLLVDFYAVWCGPCKEMKPILQEVEREHTNAKLLTVDTQKSEDIAAHFRITEIPTYILFKNGRQVWRGSGIKTADELRKIIQ